MDMDGSLRESAINDLLVEMAFRSNSCARCGRAFQHNDPVFAGLFSNGGISAVSNCCLLHLSRVGGFGSYRFGQVVWVKSGQAAFGTPGMRSPGEALDAFIAALRIHRGEKPGEPRDPDPDGDFIRL